MAVLDPRLLPLVETLAGAGADWLAFEVVDGVRRGREALEPEEQLRAAREKVRSRHPPDRLSADIPVLPEAILGDDQIVWAANYVAARLDAVLADLEAGYAMIEAIAENSAFTFKQPDLAQSEVTTDPPVKISLVGQEGDLVDRSSIAAGREGVLSLSNALARWSLAARARSFL